MNPNFKLTQAVKAFLEFYHIPSEFWDFHTAEQFAYNSLNEDCEMKFENLIKKINSYGT